MNQNFTNRWLVIEESASNWAMDFFDDPMYLNNSGDWNSVSLIMLKPETSLVLVDYYCQHIIGLLIALFNYQAVNNYLKTIINEVSILFSSIIFYRKYLKINEKEAIEKDIIGSEVCKNYSFTFVSKLVLGESIKVTSVNSICLSQLNNSFPFVSKDSAKHSISYLRSCFRLINAKSTLYKQCLFPFLLILAKKNPHGFF